MFTLPEQFTLIESLASYSVQYPENEIAKELYLEFMKDRENSKYNRIKIVNEK